MKVLDLFSGLGGFNQAFRDNGHEVITLDIEQRFRPDIRADILNIDDLNNFDVILASPPCECFSVASIGTHWGGGYRSYTPQTERALKALRIMKHTFNLLLSQKAFWFIENPRGLMRKLSPINPTTTVWLCRYGDTRAKPTDIWTNAKIKWKPQCHNGNPDHEEARRGAKTGTQGLKSSELRAKLPYGLSEWICKQLEIKEVKNI